MIGFYYLSDLGVDNMDLFRKESLASYMKTDSQMPKTMNAGDLMAMGIGAVIGSGIFILPGTVAANDAGPGVTFSFLAAAVVCGLAGMCYAEFSSAIPVAGSAYSYGNIIYGEFIGWIMGWALVLEYLLAVACVSTGWAAYFNSLLASCGVNIPKALSGPFNPAGGTYINLTAILSVLLITWLLSYGMHESVRVNNIAIAVKLLIIVAFIVIGIFFVKKANYHPFLPYGAHGAFKGATTVFFAFLGFDCISSSAAEVKHPQKNMPIGIIGTLLIATVLYMGGIAGFDWYGQLQAFRRCQPSCVCSAVRPPRLAGLPAFDRGADWYGYLHVYRNLRLISADLLA